MATSFLTLPGSLPFIDSDHSDFDDLLTVPQRGNGLCLSSSSSLEATDLLLDIAFEASGEATSSFSSPTSDASSRFNELTSCFPLVLDDLDRPQQPALIAAPLPLGPHGLKLKLDVAAVASAWNSMGGANPFQLQGQALSQATFAIPSTADLEASLAAVAVPGPRASPAGSTAEGAGPQAGAAAAAAEEARRAKEAARAAQKKASRKASERKLVYPARKLSADKRPRIKGRFVTKNEFQQMIAAQVAADRVVPAET